MVMTSDQIAQMTQGVQMQAMQGMQHASMISQQAGGPYSPQMTTGENVMGRAANMGSAMMPIAAGGLSLLGMDPMSLAARGVFSGSAMGAGMGLAAGGVMGAGLMAGQYAGKQVMMGMQEQQHLNSTLRSNFNAQGMSGRGFGVGGMGDIGQMMRGMSMEQGPGGEFTSMSQLTSMAARMGQMGGGRGVSDSREFAQKFREMMDTVKEVAEAFSTNLEQAQQVMQSMKSSGIFRRQGEVSQAVRGWAQAGGIATEEVSQAMQFGSQMSRAIGGRGVAGAMGGMKTMGQIGVMQQMGALSEEKIYDLTGQTGAAGRQALAQQQMQGAARFLKGGLGRRFIASMAAEDGSLDDKSAQEYMDGGVGTGRTMGMAGKNLGKVGRANFIRNEGRLRGAALAKFGGMAPIAVMSQWLEQRGMDPMSDRGQIFMSRRLGMSVSEVDQQMRQFRMRDQIQQKMGDVATDQEEWKRIEQQRGNTGLSGIKKGIDKFKNELNSSMRQWGAELYEEGSNIVERWLNKATGNFVQMIDKDVGQVMRDTMRGTDAYAKSIAESHLGRGRGLVGQADLNQWSKEAFGGGGGVTTGVMDAARSSGDLGRLRSAGFRGLATAGSAKDYQRMISEAEGMQNAYQRGQGGIRDLMGAGPQQYEANSAGLDVKLAASLQTSSAFGGMAQSGGDARLSAFQDVLRRGGAQGEALLSRMGTKGGTGQAAIYGDTMRAAGIDGGGGLELPDLRGRSGKGFATQKDMASVLGDYMFKAEEDDKSTDVRKRELLDGGGSYGMSAEFKQKVRGMTDSEFEKYDRGRKLDIRRRSGAKSQSPLAKFMRKTFTPDVALAKDEFGGVDSGTREGVAHSLLFTQEGRDMAFTAFGRSQKRREALSDRMKEEARDMIEKVGSAGGLNKDQLIAYETKRSIAMAADYTGLKEELGKDPTAEEIKKLAKDFGVGEKTFMQMVKGAGAAASKRQDALREEAGKRTSRQGRDALKGYAKSGAFKEGEGGKITVSKEALGRLGKLEVRKGEKGTVMGYRGTDDPTVEDVDPWTRASRKEDQDKLFASGNYAEGYSLDPDAKVATGVSKTEMGIGQAYLQAMRRASDLDLQGKPEEAAKARQEAKDLTGKLTVKGQRELAGFLETMGPGGKAAAKGINWRAGIEQRLKGQGARGPMGGVSTIADMMGVKLSDEEKKKFATMDPGEVSKRLLAKSGIDAEFGGDELKDPLEAALKAQKAGKAGVAAEDLEKVLGSGAAQKAGEKKDKERLSKEDPSYAELVKISAALERGFPAKKDKGVIVENPEDMKSSKGGEDPE